MEKIKTRFLTNTPKILGLDYTIDFALFILASPLFLFIPKYSSIYLIVIGIIHFILHHFLKGKPDKYLQNRIRYSLYDKGVWMKVKDTSLNKDLS
jgi:hypothetical protein